MNSPFGISVIVFVFLLCKWMKDFERNSLASLPKVENDHLIVLDVHSSFSRLVSFYFKKEMKTADIKWTIENCFNQYQLGSLTLRMR